MNNNRVMRKW